MKITATPCRAADLKPGDLFHNLDQTLWDLLLSKDTAALGQKVYVRTEAPVPADEAGLEVYRVTVEAEPDLSLPSYRHLALVMDALTRVLRHDGVLNSDTDPTGPELLLAAEEYCSKPAGGGA